MTEPPKIVGLHKPFKQAAPAKEIIVDTMSLALAQDIIKKIKSGALTNLGIIGIHDGKPISAVARRTETTLIQLCVLNTSVDTLKDQVKEQLGEFVYTETTDMEEDGE